MASSAAYNTADPDLGVLAARLLFAIQDELYTALAGEGFADLLPRHGAVLAYIGVDGIRATELAGLSGQHKQVVGTIIDELELLGYVVRRPDPDDRRAKLVCRTDRGQQELRAGQRIMREMQERHASRLGMDAFAQFKAVFLDVAEHQRRSAVR